MYIPRLKEWRLSKGYSMRALADAADTSVDLVFRAERGDNVYPRSARRIARGLGIEVRDLIEYPPLRVEDDKGEEIERAGEWAAQSG